MLRASPDIPQLLSPYCGLDGSEFQLPSHIAILELIRPDGPFQQYALEGLRATIRHSRMNRDEAQTQKHLRTSRRLSTNIEGIGSGCLLPSAGS